MNINSILQKLLLDTAKNGYIFIRFNKIAPYQEEIKSSYNSNECY